MDQDQLDQQEHNEKFSITPTPKQAEFITTDVKFSCYSGGYGNGKTTAGCLRSLLLSSGMPNNFGLIGRLTYPTLRDTTRRSFFELCPPEYYAAENGGEWRRSENHLKFTNGSEIIFRHMDQISEQELKSLNLGWFYIDQAEEVPESVFMVLQSRLRLMAVPNRFGFVTCNPEPGNWLFHKFKKPHDEGKLHHDYQIIEAPTSENQKNLPDDYIQVLRDAYPDEMQRRYIDGEWEVFEGQIYPEFSRRIHVIKPFDIPKGWEKIVAIDHGMVNPTAVLWGAIDYDGNVYIYNEYYNPGIVSTHVKNILEITGDQLDDISFWLIDPSTVAKTREKDGMPWSILEEYEDGGIWATPANNQILGGINRVKEFMRVDPKRRNPITGELGSPKLFIFSNCVNLINEVPPYQWRKMRSVLPRNTLERPVDYNDHALDALRYMIMSRFPAPQRKKTGYELVTPLQRKNSNSITTPFPNSHKGDDMLGQFDGNIGGIPHGEKFR